MATMQHGFLAHRCTSLPVPTRSQLVRKYCRGSHVTHSTKESPSGSAPNWPKFLATLGVTGAISGPLLDGLHSRVHLQVYDSLPIDIELLDFHTSLWVPPLLAIFYIVLGALHPVLDIAFEGPETSKLSDDKSLLSVVTGFIVVAAGIELSAYLYNSGCPYIVINATLAVVSLVVWKIFDSSKQGILLGLISATGGLLAEIPIQMYLGWWHYTNPDIAGLLVSWTFWCYFFYTPAVGNLARKMWKSSGSLTYKE